MPEMNLRLSLPLPLLLSMLGRGITTSPANMLGADNSHCTQKGSYRSCETPIGPVPNVAPVVEVALGWLHTCVRSAAGHVTCFGDNGVGQLTGDQLTYWAVVPAT